VNTINILGVLSS